MKKIVLLAPIFFLLLLVSNTLFSQDLTGIWRGYFVSEGGDQYKYEVQLTQSKKSGLTGVTYSYLDNRFYGKATFTGNYTKGTNAALVQETKTVELKMSMGSTACIMKNRLVYSRSGKEEFLEGFYSSAYEKNDLLNAVKRGGDCGGGRVFLRKVTTSDFYIEPFLRNKKLTSNTPTAGTPKTTEKATVKTPVKKPSTTITKKPVPQKESVAKKPVDKPAEIETTTNKKTENVVINAKPVERKVVPTPPTIRERKK